MSIYRRKNKGKRAKFFTAEFVHEGQLVRKNGFPDRESAKHWMLSEQLKMRRDAAGYVKPMKGASIVPLIVEFCELLVKEKGRDQKYAEVAEYRLRRLAAECAWLTIGHMTRESLETWMNGDPKYRNKKLSGKTINQFADVAFEFGKWLASRRVKKLPANPLTDVERVPEKGNDAYRRAASLGEIATLLATAPPDRRMFYIFRLYCPLRGKTIAAMTWGMMKLDAVPPYILFPAKINKSKRDEKSPLRYDVAQHLRLCRGDAEDADVVFPNPPTLDDFRDDLKAAGIPFDDGKGQRRFDFHAMRKTLIRLLKSSGVSLDQASLLLHHKDPRTTRKYYDDDTVQPELTDAMEKLPAIGAGLRRAE